MSPYKARQYVNVISSQRGDPERAHSLEDYARRQFVRACANGVYRDTPEVISQVAQILLESDDINFPRWCA